MKVKCKPLCSAICVLITVAYFAVLVFLFYNQTKVMQTGRFESDLYLHIKMAVEDKWYYSLTAFVYLFFDLFACRDMLIAVFLAFMTMGAVWFNAALVRRIAFLLQYDIPKVYAYLFSFCLNFVLAFYLPFVNKSHYVGYQSPNVWHNSTYICMRFFAVPTVLLWTYLFCSYKDKIKSSYWVGFTVLLALTTAVKPSFFMAFAPVMAFSLLYDLIKGTGFAKVFACGMSVVPAFAVMLVQSFVLFGNSSDNSFEIKPFFALVRLSDHAKPAIVLSVLFPLLVLAMHLKDLSINRLYRISWIFWLTGFLEAALLCETGSRRYDGNFLWGYYISMYFIFTVSLVMLIKDLINLKLQQSLFRKIAVVACVPVLAWHVIHGIWYLGLLLTGVTYYV